MERPEVNIMRKFWTVVCMNLFLVLCGMQATAPKTWGQTPASQLGRRNQITAKDAQALEEGLIKNPDNLKAREELISYYFETTLTSRAPELEEKREQHVLWLIEHHPESELAGSPEAEIMAMGLSESTEGYHRGKQLWLAQVESHPDSKRILLSAAQFCLFSDRKIARELLERAAALDPGDPEASSRLAQSYEQERMLVSSSEEKTALAQRALTIRERGLEKADSEDRFYELEDLATTAFEAGETAKAQQYASELLQSAQKLKNNWNYGNAVHKGNIVLGRIALRQGDIASAKEHLLAAGETPGSPQLNSFGPNMTLAKELLEKGERDIVLAYLQSCAKFWKMGTDSLQSWAATVKAGGIPEFGGNLLY
jgi:hypothetical protein